MKTSILLVEDDARLAARVKSFLEGHDLTVSVEAEGAGDLSRLQSEPFDLVVLDWMLPDVHGIDLCPLIKESCSQPVLMLTARHGERSEVAALEAGADDYVAKPVRPRVLLARIRNLLRRGPDGVAASDAPVSIGPLTIDPGRRSVTVGGQPVELTTAEYDMLAFLGQNAGRVVSRDELYLTLRGISYDGLDRSIDLRASRIRRKLERDPEAPGLLKTVRGVGYMLVRGG